MGTEHFFSTLLGGAGFFNGVFLSFYLLIRKGELKSNRILAFIILALSLKIFYAFQLNFPIFSGWSIIIKKIAISAYLLLGPMMYLLIKNGSVKKGNHVYYLNYIPSLAVLVLPEDVINSQVRFGITALIYFVYLIFNIRLWWKKASIQMTTSQKLVSDRNRNLLIGLLLIGISTITQNFIELAAIFLFLIYLMMDMILENRKILNLKTEHGEDADQKIKDEIVKNMAELKPYLDENITLDKLAELIKIPRHDLSRVINNVMSKNFPELINSYRIAEAKKKMRDPQFKNYTIAAIAMECGFKNLSTFNSAFKKNTGQTPREYMKILSNQS